ncbi:hypothetical protein HDU85_003745 [Gaertneriomyces sp. JEL0708]|nr:hypothetical protein HDU85_003745 [Gaertneriomyces sp. JEL0708]
MTSNTTMIFSSALTSPSTSASPADISYQSLNDLTRRPAASTMIQGKITYRQIAMSTPPPSIPRNHSIRIRKSFEKLAGFFNKEEKAQPWITSTAVLDSDGVLHLEGNALGSSTVRVVRFIRKSIDIRRSSQDIAEKSHKSKRTSWAPEITSPPLDTVTASRRGSAPNMQLSQSTVKMSLQVTSVLAGKSSVVISGVNYEEITDALLPPTTINVKLRFSTSEKRTLWLAHLVKAVQITESIRAAEEVKRIAEEKAAELERARQIMANKEKEANEARQALKQKQREVSELQKAVRNGYSKDEYCEIYEQAQAAEEAKEELEVQNKDLVAKNKEMGDKYETMKKKLMELQREFLNYKKESAQKMASFEERLSKETSEKVAIRHELNEVKAAKDEALGEYSTLLNKHEALQLRYHQNQKELVLVTAKYEKELAAHKRLASLIRRQASLAVDWADSLSTATFIEEPPVDLGSNIGKSVVPEAETIEELLKHEELCMKYAQVKKENILMQQRLEKSDTKAKRLSAVVDKAKLQPPEIAVGSII